jgi:hypothetical protein
LREAGADIRQCAVTSVAESAVSVLRIYMHVQNFPRSDVLSDVQCTVCHVDRPWSQRCHILSFLRISPKQALQKTACATHTFHPNALHAAGVKAHLPVLAGIVLFVL